MARTKKTHTRQKKKKYLSFRKALLTTLPINENIIVCSESPQFLLLVVAGYALSPAIKEKKKIHPPTYKIFTSLITITACTIIESGEDSKYFLQ